MGTLIDLGLAKPDNPMFSGGPQLHSVRRNAPLAAGSKLPNAPERDQFKTEEDFLEAKARWAETIGRIRAMAARSDRGK